jgi:zinc/manganese transport system substrate-binding protein
MSITCALSVFLMVWVAGLGAHAALVSVVAAENFYGDVAQQIGGPGAEVVSILSNPDEDPHLFEVSASTARLLASAQIVIFNGADYDPWMKKLLDASPRAGRETIEIASLVHRKSGDNPHLWYDPATMPALAKAVAALLAKRDPANRGGYEQRLAALQASLKPLDDKVASLKQRYAGTPVTATEPVFGHMADALGLAMRNARFQLTVMNGTEPGARDMAAFERDLRERAVRVLIVNRQTTNALTERMRKLATSAGVPVVEVTETKPPHLDYQQWMLSQLDELERALGAR